MTIVKLPNLRPVGEPAFRASRQAKTPPTPFPLMPMSKTMAILEDLLVELRQLEGLLEGLRSDVMQDQNTSGRRLP